MEEYTIFRIITVVQHIFVFPEVLINIFCLNLNRSCLCLLIIILLWIITLQNHAAFWGTAGQPEIWNPCRLCLSNYFSIFGPCSCSDNHLKLKVRRYCNIAQPYKLFLSAHVLYIYLLSILTEPNYCNASCTYCSLCRVCMKLMPPHISLLMHWNLSISLMSMSLASVILIIASHDKPGLVK